MDSDVFVAIAALAPAGSSMDHDVHTAIACAVLFEAAAAAAAAAAGAWFEPQQPQQQQPQPPWF